MFEKLMKWVRKRYFQITRSIAFYPALIATGFLLFSWAMLQLDFSEGGKQFKGEWGWLSLRDASTARSIVTAIVGGLLSLTVFSFSMVMIVLNQAASQMSNRVLSSMIENRKPQMVLGVYIGGIAYGLFLLSTIRDTDDGIYVPALSIYVLILIMVVTIFLFISFLDYVTQTVKFETVIKRVHHDTASSLEKVKTEDHKKDVPPALPPHKSVVVMEQSGYFQETNIQQMLPLATREDLVITYLHPAGTYLLKGMPLFEISSNFPLKKSVLDSIRSNTDVYHGQPVEVNADYGFRHLTEVAVKALSPGINDPATAVLSLNALADLFLLRAGQSDTGVLKDEENRVRIIKKFISFEKLLEDCLEPIWQYGKEDYMVKQCFAHLLTQLFNKNLDARHHRAIENFMQRRNIGRM